MNAFERIWVKLAFLLSGISGLAYGWLRYFGARAGEFGPEPHPFQAAAQHLHVLLAPTLVFAFGFLVRAHVLPRWRSGRSTGRWSGVLLVLVFVPMIVSGYAVQVVVEPRLRTFFAWVHGLFSLLGLGALAVHIVLTWNESRQARELAAEETA